MKEKRIFIAEDGTQFDTAEEARTHETICGRRDALNELLITFSDTLDSQEDEVYTSEQEQFYGIHVRLLDFLIDKVDIKQ